MMNDSKNNISFKYLYRDVGNYKLHAQRIFSNSDGMSIDEIEKEIKSRLIDGEFFDPLRWNFPRLSFSDFDDDLDHLWNEFDSVQITDDKPTIDKSIRNFLKEIA